MYEEPALRCSPCLSKCTCESNLRSSHGIVFWQKELQLKDATWELQKFGKRVVITFIS